MADPDSTVDIKEEWRPVRGYVGKYEVSDAGRVRALLVSGGRNSVVTKRTPPLILKPRHIGRGYLGVGLYDGHRNKVDRSIHRLVLETFIGPCPLGSESRHYDGIKTNNSLHNLSWDTKVVNTADKLRHGAQPQGRDHPLAKLTDAAVHEARTLHQSGVSFKSLGERYGVSFSAIRRAVQGTSWKHVK